MKLYMKCLILLSTMSAVMVSACAGVIPFVANPTAILQQQVAVVQPTAAWTATLPASPTPTVLPTNTPIPEPTESPSPSPPLSCNAATLVAQRYESESGKEISAGDDFMFVLRLTNSGLCTWTTEYLVILIANAGLKIVDRQEFKATAVPGQTVDIPIQVTVPDKPGSFSASWKLQNPLGEVFGHGEDGDQLFTMKLEVLEVNEELEILFVNSWIYPAEKCTNEPSNSSLPRFARLMHDPQWMPWPSRIADPDWPSGFFFDWYPETVQLWTRPKGGDGRYTYNKPWLKYLRAIQPDDEAAVWIARVAAGLFNKGNAFIPILKLSQLDEEPVAESISSGGNVVRILEKFNKSGRIEMLYYQDTPPDPSRINYFTRPWLVTKFTAVSIDGQLGNPGGIDVYFPNLTKQREGYWVDMQRVEMFPGLPLCAGVGMHLEVMASPNSNATQIGVLTPGQEIVIREYLPQGSEVWGRMYEGWVLLEFLEDGWPVFATTWEMETRPPMLIP